MIIKAIDFHIYKQRKTKSIHTGRMNLLRNQYDNVYGKLLFVSNHKRNAKNLKKML